MISPSGQAWAAAWLAALLVAVPVALSAWTLDRQFSQDTDATLQAEATSKAEEWRALVDRAARAMLVLQIFWREREEFDAMLLQNLTASVLDATPELDRILLVDASGNVSWAVPPSAETDAEFGANTTWAALFANARDGSGPVVSSLMPLRGSAEGIAIVLAVPPEAGETGAIAYLAGLMRIQDIADALLLDAPTQRFAYGLGATEQEETTFGAEPAGEALAVIPLDIDGVAATPGGEPPILTVRASQGLVERAGSRTPLIVAALGAVVAAGSGGAGWAIVTRRHERREAAARLAESERHYASLFRDAGEMIFLLSPTGQFLDVNPRTTETLKRREDELQKLTIFDVVEDDDQQIVRDILDGLQNDPKHRNLEWTFVLPGGARVETYGTLTPAGSSDWIVVQAHLADITRLKRLERNLRHANEDLENRVRDLDSFAHSVAHDLKNPIRAVASFASFVREEDGAHLSNEGLHHIGEIEKAATRMKALIDGMLLFASAGPRGDQQRESIEVRKLIDEALSDLSPLIRERRAHVAVMSGMPTLQGFRIPLKQVFTNLIANAINHNPADEPQVVIDAHPITSEEWEFSVDDNGPGIPEEDRDRIFDLFHRAPGVAAGGMGVGLAIVRRIIDQHDGRVWVTASEGGGSRFVFRLPIMAPESVPRKRGAGA